MRVESVEIYSDATNAAVLRHPGRSFPGLLLQGDTLHGLCSQVDRLHAVAKGLLPEDKFDELTDLRAHLRELLAHYKQVLMQHGRSLPFVE